jgi:hypothetical protein
MFNGNFFRFFFGFVAVIGVSLLVAFISSTYADGGTGIGDLIANFFR